MLFPFSRGPKGSHLDVKTRTEHIVEVTNTGQEPQQIGSITIAPGETVQLPYEIAKALIGKPNFRVSWNVGSDVRVLHVIRYPGLGDRIFAMAACYAFHRNFPEAKIYFETFPNDRVWINWVPFVEFGNPPVPPSKAVNLDNAPTGGEDRCRLYGRLLGVDVYDIRFPISVPKISIVPDKPYILFAPCNSGRAMTRSLAPKVVQHVLQCDFGYDLVLVDRQPIYMDGPRAINLTGKTSLAELWSLARYAEAVISVDTGVAWMGACLGKPTLVFFSYINPAERVQTCHTVWAVEPSAPCCPCGDRLPPMPCGVKAGDIPICMRTYTPWVVEAKIREFLYAAL
ncbi:MAG: hypothetical protein JRD89_00150 [Deltaproteobacteria bacterium]|nr:hypothetical protein [Deltaproteobacteria bacterium]